MDDLVTSSCSAGALDEERFSGGEEIARGGIGIIRALWDRLLGRRVALKELRPDGNPGDTARFLDEARIMGALDHPNVVPVYDLRSDARGGPPRLLMKLVEGRTLREVFHETGAPPSGMRLERLLGVVIKVCDAVSFAHSRGVIHRDLHPANVMVGTHGQVYVMDWGLAIHRAAATARGTALSACVFGSGTPAYMAPEQAHGRYDQLDERTDVFGVGALLYHMLTLHAPFEGDNFGDVLDAARRCRPVPPDVLVPEHPLPARLCSVVMRALAASREERHPSVEALRDDLEEVLRSGGWFPGQHFPKGTLLLREREAGDRAYIVTAGTCEVFRNTPHGIDVLREVGPGGVVGEIGLFTGAPRVASVRAMTDVSALIVTPEAIEHELRRATWMRAFVETAIERFAELDELRRQDHGCR